MEEYELKIRVVAYEDETPTESLYNLLTALQDTERWQGMLSEAVVAYKESHRYGGSERYNDLDQEYAAWNAIAGTIERAVAQAVFDRAANEIKM